MVFDLYCGLGGWTKGFLAEGYDAVGFDIERHRYPASISSQEGAVKRPGMNWSDRSLRGSEQAQFNRAPKLDPRGGWKEYPAQLVLQDVLTLHGSQFRDAAVIVASPPCQAYSYRAMPWKRAKALPPPDNALFDACFRIQREACEAAGRYIPLVVENVCGAQKWVGRAKWHYGSYYLWGDVPALMPLSFRVFKNGGNGRNLHFHEKTGLPIPNFSTMAVNEGLKTVGHINKRDGHTHARHLTNQYEHDAVKQHLSGRAWFDEGAAAFSSKGLNRKAASAMIAEIPLPLARWIAQVYRPEGAR
jgi:hypothetical protein